jgi:hypothetical protein
LTGSLVDGGNGGNSDIENAGHMHVVPFFLVERMNTILHHQAFRIFSIDQQSAPQRATQFKQNSGLSHWFTEERLPLRGRVLLRRFK